MVFREKGRYRLREHKIWEEEIKRKEEAGELFCKSCGTPITEKHTYCPKCGNFLVDDEKVKKEVTHKKHKNRKKESGYLFKELKLVEDEKRKKEREGEKHGKPQKKEDSPVELLFFVISI